MDTGKPVFGLASSNSYRLGIRLGRLTHLRTRTCRCLRRGFEEGGGGELLQQYVMIRQKSVSTIFGSDVCVCACVCALVCIELNFQISKGWAENQILLFWRWIRIQICKRSFSSWPVSYWPAEPWEVQLFTANWAPVIVPKIVINEIGWVCGKVVKANTCTYHIAANVLCFELTKQAGHIYLHVKLLTCLTGTFAFVWCCR